VENGTISASPATAYKNETVTLSATPAAGYYFGEWTVTDAGNNTIPVSNNQFTMPDSDVTVSATFVQGYAVTLASATNGSVSATPTNCVPGTSVTLTATPASGYVLDSWMVFKTGDVNTPVTVSGNSFTMPGHDVTVVGIFNAQQGGEVTIGSGTSSTGNIPTNSNKKYSLSQQIYPASVIGGAGTITAVAFKVSNSYSATRTLEIYLSHTTKSSFSSRTDWVQQATATKVFSGSVAFAASGWTTITLDTPFEYNGTSNLLVTVDDNTNTAISYSYPKFSYSTTSDYNSLFIAGNTNYNPASISTSTTGTWAKYYNNIILTKAISGATEMLSVAPDAMDGFTYVQGEGPSPAKAVTLVAYAAEDLTVTAPDHFEVSGEADGTYGSTLTLSAGSRGGRETLSYDFEDGYQGWTLLKGSTGNSPNNWMHNTEYPTTNNNFSTGYGHNSSDGFMLSESYISGSSSGSGTAVTPDNYLVSPQVELGGSISFYAGARNTSYCAEKFSVMVSTTDNTNTASFTTVATYVLSLSAVGYTTDPYTIDLSAYSGQGYVAIRHWDCNDQWFLCIDDITIVEGEGGTNPSNPTNPTTELLAANVYVRLKGGLSQGTYANETLSVSTGDLTGNVSLSGEVTQGSQVTQSFSLSAGWNWWSPCFETEGAAMLTALEEALGTKGATIKSIDQSTLYYSQYGIWYGTLNTLVPERMYMIEVTEACTVTLTGAPVNPTEHPITVNPGSNWIGCPTAVSVPLSTAFAGFTPQAGDVIKTRNASATYYESYGWYGTLETLEPGKGYIYQSNATGPVTFTINASAK